ncbi:hypothetical protein FHS72_003540 [Loktanella ponticola]|uniref:Uncharacterized protein n=1 Tax=Yoonia ponticola TaxID=1524255 RepID=A0A7W9EZH9_9RHOB|nr:hypothetical protein [Yoonia ponticola]MBB5723893.1 hypothetical protein [Yoonia ponticola]
MWRLVLMVWYAGIAPEIAVAQDYSNNGWVQQSFDFESPHLNFTTTVMNGASVKTIPMRGPEQGEIGKILAIGNVADPREWMLVNLIGYSFATPVAPEPLCRSELEREGYQIRAMRSTPDMTMTEALSVASNSEHLTKGVYTRCYARGNITLVLHVFDDVSDITTQEAYNARRAAALDLYTRFTTDLIFEDGASANFGGMLQEVTVKFGDDRVDFTVSEIWDVAINDFTGSLPAEMQLFRNRDGQTLGVLWLHVAEGPEPTDLAEVAARFVTQYFSDLTQQVGSLEVVSNVPDEDLSELKGRRVRVAVNGFGDIEASVIWHDGRLYVLGLWQNYEQPADRSMFYTRLAAHSSFVMMKNDLVRSLP